MEHLNTGISYWDCHAVHLVCPASTWYCTILTLVTRHIMEHSCVFLISWWFLLQFEQTCYILAQSCELIYDVWMESTTQLWWKVTTWILISILRPRLPMLAMDTTSSWVWQELQMSASWNCNFLHLFFFKRIHPWAIHIKPANDRTIVIMSWKIHRNWYCLPEILHHPGCIKPWKIIGEVGWGMNFLKKLMKRMSSYQQQCQLHM